MDAGVLNVAFALRGQFFTQVGGVLVLDILDDGVPAAIVVDQVAVARRVDDVEPETHTAFFQHMGDGVDFGGLAYGLAGVEAAFRVDEVGGEDGVDKGRFAETRLAWEISR